MGTGRKFNWIWLVIAIVAVAAFASENPRMGKWIFAIVVISALLLASNQILNSVGGSVKTPGV